MAVAAPDVWQPPPSVDPETLVDPGASARAAGLRYISDLSPGIRRKRAGASFRYAAPDGRALHDTETLGRIKRLAVPPAWRDVWISPDPRGHIQATGRDARGRKQYRYHPRWRQVRDAVKYDRMLAFAQALPRIRERTDKDLERAGMPKEKVLAAIVRLLEETRIRVGNEEYRKENHSFGLTTLRDRQVEVIGSEVRFAFHGKSGKLHRVTLRDRRMARLIARSQEIPGQELFEYLDENGEPKTIRSEDVNEYLREVSGEDFTAKDFRTWAGTILAARFFREAAITPQTRGAKKALVRAIAHVADELGNTPAIARKSYIHPAVIAAFLAGSLKPIRYRAEQDPYKLSAEERGLLKLLSAQQQVNGNGRSHHQRHRGHGHDRGKG